MIIYVSFSSSGESDESDEEQIKTIWLMSFGNVFFEGTISKMLYNFLSFSNKTLLTFVCNSCSEKEFLNIKKGNSKTGNFI